VRLHRKRQAKALSRFDRVEARCESLGRVADFEYLDWLGLPTDDFNCPFPSLSPACPDVEGWPRQEFNDRSNLALETKERVRRGDIVEQHAHLALEMALQSSGVEPHADPIFTTWARQRLHLCHHHGRSKQDALNSNRGLALILENEIMLNHGTRSHGSEIVAGL